MSRDFNFGFRQRFLLELCRKRIPLKLHNASFPSHGKRFAVVGALMLVLSIVFSLHHTHLSTQSISQFIPNLCYLPIVPQTNNPFRGKFAQFPIHFVLNNQCQACDRTKYQFVRNKVIGMPVSDRFILIVASSHGVCRASVVFSFSHLPISISGLSFGGQVFRPIGQFCAAAAANAEPWSRTVHQ